MSAGFDAIPASKARAKMNVEVVPLLIERSKRLWRSSRSGRVGVVASQSHTGDKICALLGSSILYVLRAVAETGRHLFIGEAYLHGCIDELVLDRSPEDFILI
jgi:hypothetical protein